MFWTQSVFATGWQDTGRILFLVQQGKNDLALQLYRQHYTAQGIHNYELLHKIALGLLDYGFRQNDPESQLMALFGASVSAHDEAYYILEQSIQSRYPQIQLVSLQALARFQNDQADKTLTRALSSEYLPIRFEAIHQLCLKKHPKAVAQAESLMYKIPKEYASLFPQLYAHIESEASNQILRRLLNHTIEEVRVEAILNIAKKGRDDFLPQIRQLASHVSFSQQEACSYALGVLKDSRSIARLTKLSQSQYPTVALAANQALYRIERHPAALQAITEKALDGQVIAVQILGKIEGTEDTLVQLMKHRDFQVRLNATLSLLEKNDIRCIEGLKDILIHDNRNLAFTSETSPGRVFKTAKGISSASQLLKNDQEAYIKNLKFKENVLTKAQNLPENVFLTLADQLFSTHQHELIATVVNLLEESGSENSVLLLKKYQQQPGAPYIRQYCNLALYRLKEQGPYGESLRLWVKSKQEEELIRFTELPSIEIKNLEAKYKMEPEEISRLLIDTFEAFAEQQDEEGLETLLEAIEHGHKKSKYALAGLLLRATQ